MINQSEELSAAAMELREALKTYAAEPPDAAVMAHIRAFDMSGPRKRKPNVSSND
jgi:hypothetical protein